MASKSTSQQARKQARQRATEAAAERELEARQRFEAELAAQREQAKANEDDLTAFFAAETAIDDAKEHLAITTKESTIAMADAAQAIVERQGSVSAAAELLGVPASRISSLTRAAAKQRAAQTDVTEPDDDDTGKTRDSQSADEADTASGGGTVPETSGDAPLSD